MNENELLLQSCELLLDYAKENNVELNKQQVGRYLKAVCNVISNIKQSKMLNSFSNLK